MAKWIIPCNPAYYDVEGAFKRLNTLEWRQHKRFEVGDIVYIYVSKPVGAIMYKCRVLKVDISGTEIDDSLFVNNNDALEYDGPCMLLGLIRRFRPDELSFDILSRNGLKGSVQGQRHTNDQLDMLFERVEQSDYR